MQLTVGRPTKATQETFDAICKALREGNTRKGAAEIAGISSALLRKWVGLGRSGEPEFLAFLAQLKKAESDARHDAIQSIIKQGKAGSWQALAWWLERRCKAWRKPVEVHTTQIEKKKTKEELQKEIEEYLPRIQKVLSRNGGEA